MHKMHCVQFFGLANASGARYAIIIGEDEVKAGTLVLRDLAKGEQQTVSVEQALRRLQE